jgi:hypothetical protein
VEKALNDIQQALQKLIGLHRQLLETVRMEHDALVQADVKGVEEAVFAKQALIAGIRQAEAERIRALAELALALKKPLKDLGLTQLIIEVQGRDPRTAEQLRSAFNALTILIKRATEQNGENRALVERSLEHVNAMKKNVLGEARPNTAVYDQKGQRSTGQGGSRLLSKEI